MLEGTPPQTIENCDNRPIARSMALAQQLQITSTPTLIFSNGERVSGAMPYDRIVQRLDNKKSSVRAQT